MDGGHIGSLNLVELLSDLRATVYLATASITFLIYDHMLTFADEVEYVWKSRSSLPKYLFLANRYLVPTMFVISMHAFSGIGYVPLSDSFCKVWAVMSVIIGPISIANGTFIVLLRLWVIWDRRLSLVVFTLLCYLASQIATFTIAIRVAIQANHTVVYFPLTRTCILPQRMDLVPLWAPGVFFEVVTAATTWWHALSIPRTHDAKITRQLYKDGSVLTFLLLGLRTFNMVTAAAAPLPLTMIGIFFVWSCTTTSVSRLVLNVRRVSAQRHQENLRAARAALAATQTHQVIVVPHIAVMPWRPYRHSRWQSDDGGGRERGESYELASFFSGSSSQDK